MNAAFELLQAEMSVPTKVNVEVGSPKAFAIAEKLSQVGSLKAGGRWLGKGQAHERERVRQARRRSAVVRSVRRYRSKRTARVPQR